MTSGAGSAHLRHLLDAIQRHYVGPDCYWKSHAEQSMPQCRRFFGNAWFIPFPPTVVRIGLCGPHEVLMRGFVGYSL